MGIHVNSEGGVMTDFVPRAGGRVAWWVGYAARFGLRYGWRCHVDRPLWRRWGRRGLFLRHVDRGWEMLGTEYVGGYGRYTVNSLTAIRLTEIQCLRKPRPPDRLTEAR